MHNANKKPFICGNYITKGDTMRKGFFNFEYDVEKKFTQTDYEIKYYVLNNKEYFYVDCGTQGIHKVVFYYDAKNFIASLKTTLDSDTKLKDFWQPLRIKIASIYAMWKNETYFKVWIYPQLDTTMQKFLVDNFKHIDFSKVE